MDESTAITPEALFPLYARSDVYVCDVSDEAVSAAHHIPGAYNIPYRARSDGSSSGVFLRMITKAGIAQHTPIVVYGESGGNRTAYMAMQALRSAGYTNIKYLSGGLADWAAAGYPVYPQINDCVPEIKTPAARSKHNTTTDTLLAHGYTTIHTDAVTHAKTAANAFMDFVALPQAVKQQFVRSETAPCMCADSGFRSYSHAQRGFPDQELFVYDEYIARQCRNVTRTYPAAYNFMEMAGVAYASARNALADTLTEVAEVFPNAYESFFPSEGEEPAMSLWFLKYPYPAHNEEIMQLCSQHFDYGGCTLALTESAPGLRVGRDAQELHAPERLDGTALFLPALEFYRTTDARLGPVWHDVQQNRTHGLSPDIARWSVVFFADHTHRHMCDVCGKLHKRSY